MKIEKLGGDVFMVTISGTTKTEHKVTVTDNHHKRLTDGRVKKKTFWNFHSSFFWKENRTLQ